MAYMLFLEKEIEGIDERDFQANSKRRIIIRKKEKSFKIQ